ncbi:hypothetical protein ACFL3Q_12530, partial [Planctomycetota bacterium]
VECKRLSGKGNIGGIGSFAYRDREIFTEETRGYKKLIRCKLSELFGSRNSVLSLSVVSLLSILV